jgi:hypothetical protein
VIAPGVLYGMPETYLTKSNRMALRVMEETIIMILQRATARRVDAYEEPDHRMIGKMLDNKIINNKIAILRTYMKTKEGTILRKAEAYEIRGKLKIKRPCHTNHEACERDAIKSDKNGTHRS